MKSAGQLTRAIAAISFVLCSFYGRAWGATINVCKSGCAYSTIQAGIDAANYLDTVTVGPGTYSERISFHGKVITLQSSGGAVATTIDGGNAGTVVTLEAGSAQGTVIDGFTITNGNTTSWGGGIYSVNGSAPTITNCAISGNHAKGGGGIFAWNATITNCTISNNSTSGSSTMVGGGGIFCYSGSISNCTVTGNVADNNGGGIFIQGGAVTNCNIAGNTAGFGGGIYIYNNGQSDPGIASHCTVSNNTARSYYGGGIYNSGGQVTDSAISNNSAAQKGGGIYGNFGTVSNCDILNNTANQNGGGIYSYGSTVSNCNISDNSATNFGGGVFGEQGGNVSHCNISRNTADSGGGIYGSFTTSDLTIIGNTATYGGGARGAYLVTSFIAGNSASSDGGGAYDTFLVNCTVSGNKALGMGGGAYLPYGDISPGEARVQYTTLSGNYAGYRGGGIVAVSGYQTKVVASILWGNLDGEPATSYDEIYLLAGAAFTITYSDIKNGWQGVGNFNADPLFVARQDATAAPTALGDYHVTPGSPCVDKVATPTIAVDIDGEARPYGDGYDVGSDEYQPKQAWRTGEVDMGGGWKWTNWFGMYNTNSAPWIYHAQHGWLYPYDNGNGAVFFWYHDMQKFVWTSSVTYPFLYRFSANPAWIWYLKDSANPRLFYNYGTGAWESLP